MQIKETHVPYCQIFGKPFRHLDICYYAPLDGNIVCAGCSEIHEDRQIRVCVRD